MGKVNGQLIVARPTNQPRAFSSAIILFTEAWIATHLNIGHELCLDHRYRCLSCISFMKADDAERRLTAFPSLLANQPKRWQASSMYSVSDSTPHFVRSTTTSFLTDLLS